MNKSKSVHSITCLELTYYFWHNFITNGVTQQLKVPYSTVLVEKKKHFTK